MKNRLLYGPCGPLPSRNEADWVKELQEGYGSKTTKAGDAVDVFAAPTPLPFVTPAWEAINNTASSEGSVEECPVRLIIGSLLPTHHDAFVRVFLSPKRMTMTTMHASWPSMKTTMTKKKTRPARRKIEKIMFV
jgi:hypothetical protein